MNPPYAQPLVGDFAEAATAKYASGEYEQACISSITRRKRDGSAGCLEEASAVCFEIQDSLPLVHRETLVPLLQGRQWFTCWKARQGIRLRIFNDRIRSGAAMSFDESLAYGKVGESIISRYMQSRGHAVLPVRDRKRPWERAAVFSIGKWLIARICWYSRPPERCSSKQSTSLSSRGTRQQRVDYRHRSASLRRLSPCGERNQAARMVCVLPSRVHPSESDRAHGCPSECPTGLVM